MQITVSSLNKSYRVVNKKEGLRGSIKNFFQKEYTTVQAVKDINFSIKKGECIGFIGPNGAGKTTTIKMMTGLIYPTNGEITVMGYRPSSRKNSFKKEISLVMGNKFQLWWDLPAIESFHLHRKIYDINIKDFEERLDILCQMLNIKHLIHTPVRNLSLGERMKMELVTSLLHKPQILFLDEPTIGLDYESQQAIRKFLKEYNKENNTTIIMTSHYIEDIEAVCDRLVMIRKGSIVFDGSKKQLYDKYRSDISIYFKSNDRLPEYITSNEQISIRKKDNEYEISTKKENYISILKQLINTKAILDLKVGEVSLDVLIQRCYKDSGARQYE